MTRFDINSLRISKLIAWPFSIVLTFLTTILSINNSDTINFQLSDRFLILLLASGIAVTLLKLSDPDRISAMDFLLVMLLGAVIYKISSFIPEIQSAPFSLGWSEASRYYNASLFFSDKIYGKELPLPVLHPSRYFLQSIPFMFGIKSILIHRLWQVILWFVLIAVGSFSIVKKLTFKDRLFALVFGLWLFLFFFQGAVYYHLIVCVIIVIFGYKQNQPWRTLIFVVIASIWAGISRVNWFPVPASLAIVLFLLKTPVRNLHWLRYLKYPMIWLIIGVSSALYTNQMYAIFSDNTVEQFSSSFSSYMVWSRLFPNTTFQLGIIPGILLVICPLAILTVLESMNNPRGLNYHWIRIMGLIGILLVFGFGGIIVSVKVGGGADLHNLDAFLVFWVIITTHIILSKDEKEFSNLSYKPTINFGLLFITILVPIMFSLQSQFIFKFAKPDSQNEDIKAIQEIVDLINKRGSSESILFITERHLITFDEIQNVKFEPDYEKVFLMEMVMSNNQLYLDDFHKKLINHEFSAIITDSISPLMKDSISPFWVENNLWVDEVIYPIIDNYQLIDTFQDGTINLLIPND